MYRFLGIAVLAGSIGLGLPSGVFAAGAGGPAETQEKNPPSKSARSNRQSSLSGCIDQ